MRRFGPVRCSQEQGHGPPCAFRSTRWGAKGHEIYRAAKLRELDRRNAVRELHGLPLLTLPELLGELPAPVAPAAAGAAPSAPARRAPAGSPPSTPPGTPPGEARITPPGTPPGAVHNSTPERNPGAEPEREMTTDQVVTES
jgi:hypothetical protein